jgi:hypothetical protein
VQQKLQRVRDIWPIMPGSEKPPEDWPGWPDGKKFAFVLTHDKFRSENRTVIDLARLAWTERKPRKL